MPKLDRLRQALADHQATCAACQANQPCSYRTGAEQRIAQAEAEARSRP